MKLTRDEKKLLDSVEKGGWKRVPDFSEQSGSYRELARASLRKDKRVRMNDEIG